MPKVTVLIPSYNHAKFIGEAIQSVLDQTFQDFEIIIKDDGSSDNSLDVIRSFSDPRIRVEINEQNMCGGILNDIIPLAKGEYLALLNSDDVWMLDKLEKQVKFLDENPQYVAVFSDIFYINEIGEPYDSYSGSSWFSNPINSRIEYLRHCLNLENKFAHPTVLIRKFVYQEIGVYNKLLFFTPDLEMWTRVLCKYSMYVIDEKLAKFRWLSNNQNASSYNHGNVLRSAFEAGKIFDAFCSIEDLDIFNKLFNNYAAINVKEIQFKFALYLLENKKENYVVLWALNKIYDLLRSNLVYYSDLMSRKEFKSRIAQYDVYDIFFMKNAVSRLLYDTGNGFNWDECIIQGLLVDKNKFTFDVSHLCNINRIRLDLINQPARIKFTSGVANLSNGDIVPLSMFWHNAEVIDDVYDFKHPNAQMIFIIPDEMVDSLRGFEFQFSFNVYNKQNVLDFLSSSMHELELNDSSLENIRLNLDSTRLELDSTRLELDSTRLELDNTRLELDNTRLELDNTRLELDNTGLELDNTGLELDSTRLDLFRKNSELLAIYQSKSWKITSIFREIKKNLRF